MKPKVFGEATTALQLGSMLAAVLVIGGLMGMVHVLDRREDSLVRLVVTADNAINRVKQLNEILTMSARMYAASGLAAYRLRHEQHGAELNRLFADLAAMVPDGEFQQRLAETIAVNNDMVKLEREAVTLTDAGTQKAAVDLLHSDDYQALSQRLNKLMSQTMMVAHYRNSADLGWIQSEVWIANMLCIALLFAVSILTVITSRASQRRLLLEHNKMLQSRDALLAEVEERKRTEHERMQIAQDLQSSEARHRLVVESALDAVISIDTQGRIVDWNVQAEQTFGWSRVEAIGRSLAETIVPAHLRDRHSAGLANHLVHGDSTVLNRRRETSALRRDGTEFPIELALIPVKIGGKQLFTAFLRDITEQKTADAELRQHRDNLRELVESRTLDLMAAKEAAEHANAAKGQFLANMSHEIRTPMNAVIGLSHLALKANPTPKQADYLTKIHEAGTSLLAILNDILDFSKIEAGKLDLDRTEFALDEVLFRILSVIGFRAREKHLELIVTTHPDVPSRLIGDALRLQQVLLNLLNNAVKFTAQGDVRLHVDLVSREAENVLLRFVVSDTGIGMTQEQCAALFQPFYQADTSHTRKFGGTGLGLSICKRLIELMQGNIEVTSVPSQGTQVTFTAPLTLGQEAAPLDQRVPTTMRNLRVLVVDDHVACSEAVRGMMEALGYQAETAQSAEEALQKIAASADQPFDIVFMDWNMPAMNGIDAAQTIKADLRLKRQPAIVMVTAYDQPEVREHAQSVHVDGFLVKPVSASMLLDSLVAIFARSEGSSNTHTDPVEEVLTQDLSGLRVLLVEDNPINQQIACELLAGWSAEVVVANNGAEALTVLNSHAADYFGLVLMDIQMPQMDGYEAVRHIREQARYKVLPVIAMTAHALLQERHRCLDAGMNDYIAKPIDPSTLLKTLQRWHTQLPSVSPYLPPLPIAASPVAVNDDNQVVDIDLALARFKRKPNLLAKVVRQFLGTYAEAPEQLSQFLRQGQIEEAHRLAHTLAGLYAYVGAMPLQILAQSIECAIHEDSELLKRSLATLSTEHPKAVTLLQQWLASSEQSAA